MNPSVGFRSLRIAGAGIVLRGAGASTPDNPYPENSLSSFRKAIAPGANGIELDVELTSDGRLIVMHDDMLDRTATCTGCVSAYTLAEVRECNLLDGDGQPTIEVPPPPPESYDAVQDDALVNVWTVPRAADMQSATNEGVTAIVTDESAVLVGYE